MNLLRLKKSQLVELCHKDDITPKGTIAVLKEKLLKTGKHWNLSFIKTKTKDDSNHPYSNVKQVSRIKLKSFSVWLNNIEYAIESSAEDYPDIPFRELFDTGYTEEQCLKATGFIK